MKLINSNLIFQINNGKIKRVATNTFIITPYNVDLTGDDVMDELENNGVYF